VRTVVVRTPLDNSLKNAMKLLLNAPVALEQHFEVPVDHTTWPNKTYRKTKSGWTPTRPQATFGTWNQGLTALTRLSHELTSTFGMYILAFDKPYPAIYIGIAADDGTSPEGISNRVKKHRVKATGSHVSASQDTVGGVAHMKNWRKFAIDRASFHQDQELFDSMADARLITAAIQGSSGQRKKDLERFEKAIIADQRGIRSSIEKLLWPDFEGKVFLLNGEKGKPSMLGTDEVILWADV
jgi:hypothetical protein